MSYAETIEAFGKLGTVTMLALTLVAMVWMDYTREERLIEIVRLKIEADAIQLEALQELIETETRVARAVEAVADKVIACGSV